MREIMYLIGFIKTQDAFLSMLCSLCGAVFSILLLATSAYLIASAAFNPPLYTLSAAITLVRAAGLFRAVFRYLERIISHKAAFDREEKLRLSYFDLALETLPIKENSLKISRTDVFIEGIIRGTEKLRDFFVRSLMPPAVILTLGLITCLILFPIIGWFGFTPLLLVLLHISAPMCLKEDLAAKKFAASYGSLILDKVNGKKLLIFAGSANRILPLLKKSAAEFTKAADLDKLFRLKLNFFMELSRNIFLIILIISLIGVYDNGLVNTVWLSVYIILALAVFEECAAIPDACAKGKSALRYAKDLNEKKSVVNTICEKNISKDSYPILEVKNLGFSYNPEQYIFKDLSFTLNEGERLAILGESGAGKTTLASCLLGLYKADLGHILLNGIDYANLSQHEIRSHFAPLLQGAEIFSGSIGDNFKFIHKNITDSEIKAALQKVNLNFDLNRNCQNISGGEKIRLTLALALASHAPILLLDEPTMSLDRKTADAIMKNILTAEIRSMIIITHDKNLAKLMDKSIMMN